MKKHWFLFSVAIFFLLLFVGQVVWQSANKAEVIVCGTDSWDLRRSRSMEKIPTDLCININTADEEALELLPGIGKTKAAAIVAYREDHGAFAAVEELLNVSGIGEKLFDGLREFVTVGEESAVTEE